MRVLGIETSTRRGSVALVDGDQVVAHDEEEHPQGHDAHLLAQIERLLQRATWSRQSLERVAASVGPGSFTGLRVGLAVAEGLGLALGIQVVGVCSLRAMAAAVPPGEQRLRCPMLGAGQNQVFTAAYDSSGEERWSPRALPRGSVLGELRSALAGHPILVLGETSFGLEADSVFRSEWTDLPHAVLTARLGARAIWSEAPIQALYLRPPNAVLPELPPNPLAGNPR
ncbi:MAG TPA: tRNA (adenosine(37)-N6)-threonylcarbamoyltransferase complex dimerization subunit type 1 TsaB [Polyangiaceae bacterium]|jgi:tRNA threonylcarbamoyladenosine biosynthesis protein TsaB